MGASTSCIDVLQVDALADRLAESTLFHIRSTCPGLALSRAVPRSDVRQVPDTQEVFTLPDSDVSILFEILQIVSEGDAKDDLQEAAR